MLTLKKIMEIWKNISFNLVLKYQVVKFLICIDFELEFLNDFYHPKAKKKNATVRLLEQWTLDALIRAIVLNE